MNCLLRIRKEGTWPHASKIGFVSTFINSLLDTLDADTQMKVITALLPLLERMLDVFEDSFLQLFL